MAKNTIRLTESELKRVITESVKRIISENAHRTVYLDAYEIFDPENGDEQYALSILNSANPGVKQAAQFMYSLVNNDQLNMRPFEVLLDARGYDDEWDDPCVDVMDYPDELNDVPKNIRQTILTLVEEYVDEKEYYWDVYDSDWIWDSPEDKFD